MPSSLKTAGRGSVKILDLKLRNLGLESEEERNSFLMLFKGARRVPCGEDVVESGKSNRGMTVLLSGMACRYRMSESGRRQISTFHLPGDFCDSYGFVLPEWDEAVEALTDCWIDTVSYEEVDRLLNRHANISIALWRNMAVEARILRERLAVQGSALGRVASLLCEQMVRLEAVGMNGDLIPLTQIDLADAAGLSVVHVNRTIHELRELGVLSKDRNMLRLVNRERLVQIARFDGRYLAPMQASSKPARYLPPSSDP
jgi:CRP-like cAMP-binding protein